MSRTWKIGGALALAAVVGLSGCAGPGTGGDPETGDITLPAIEMLTGDVSYYGQLFMNGVELAVDQVNAEGGIDGRQVTLVQEDNASGNSQTVTLIRKYCSDDSVGILIAPTYQTNSDAGGPVSNSCGLPTVTGVGDITDGTNPDGFMFKNTTVRLPDQVNDTLEYAIAKVDATSVAQITDTSVGPYVLYQEAGSDYLKDQGIDEVGDQSVNGSLGSYGPQITALVAADPQLVVVTLQPNDAAHFIEEARDRGLDAQFVATCGCLNDPSVYENSHGAAEGFLSSSPNPPPAEAAEISPQFDAFVKAYTEKFGEFTSPEAVYTYDSALMVFEAIRQAGSSTDREKIKAALEGMTEFSGGLSYVNKGGGTFATTELYFTSLTADGFVIDDK